MDLLGPRQELRVTTIEQYRARVRQASRAIGIPVTPDVRRVVAFADHGHWRAMCPNCNAGISVHLEWPYAACLGCCTEYAGVDVPAEWAEIERVLRPRNQQNRNWVPGETIADLRRDNQRHGVR